MVPTAPSCGVGIPAASAAPSAATAFLGSFDFPSAGPLPRSAGSERALISAPCWIRSWMAGAWPSSAAHIKAVVPRRVSFAFTSAPWSSSTLIASTLPVRDATMSGVLPSGSCSLASAPALSSAAMIGASPLMLASHKRRGAVAVRGLGIRAGAKQEVDHRFVGSENRPVQRGRAIGLRRIHIGVLLDQLLRRPPGPRASPRRQPQRFRRRSEMASREAQQHDTASDDALRHCVLYRFVSRPVLSPMLSW